MKKFLLYLVAMMLVATVSFGATAYRYQGQVQSLRGDAVGAATATVYLAGTTTKASLYSTGSTGGASLNNPVYTDGYGRYYFYAAAGLYDITISGSNVVSYTLEDVRIFSPAPSVFNIEDYGAVSDDGNSDFDAIQDAIDAAEAASGRVFIPAGIWVSETDSTLVIDSDDVMIYGTGSASRIVGAGGADDVLLDISAPDVTIKDVTFVGLRSAETGGANEAIRLLDGADNCTITGCLFTGQLANWGFNVHIRTETGADNFIITDNRFERVIGMLPGYGYGIQVSGATGGIISDNVSVQASDNGRHHIYLSYGSSNVIISDNVFIGGTSAMITMYDNNSLPNQNCQITNNILDGGGTGGGTGGGIEIVDEAFGNLVQGNTIYDVNGFGIKIEGTNETPYHTYDNVLDNNIITDSDSSGIFIKYAKTTMVTDNRLINTSTSGDRAAIWLLDGGTAPCDSTIISGNHVSGSANTYAVTMDGSDVMVSGNFFESGSTGTYQAVATSGSQVFYNNIDDRPKNQFNVLDYGAVPDDGVDDSSGFQSAIDAAAGEGGGRVLVPTGAYVANQISLKSRVWLIGQSGSSILKVAGSVSDTNNVINMLGTTSATLELTTADVDPGDVVVSVDDGETFSVGDWCFIRDSTWADYGVSGRNQEMVQVASISTDDITLTNPVFGSYATADTTQLVVIEPVVDATVIGLEIVIPTGTDTGGGIYGESTARCSVSDCTVTGANDNPAIGFESSYDINITNNRMISGQSIDTAGYGYAVSIDESCHHVRVSGNHQESMRESVIANRSRSVVFTGNSSRGGYDAHANTHGSWCDGVVISNNVTTGGRYGYSAGFTTHKKGDENVIISGNIISNTGYYAITVNAPSGKENNNITVSGNSIAGFGITTASSSGILIGNTNRALVSGNNIDGMGGTNAAYGILIVDAVDSHIVGNLVSDNSNGYGVTITDCTNVHVMSNTAFDISSHNFRTTGTNTGCSFKNNVADDTTVSLSSVALFGNSWQSGLADYAGNPNTFVTDTKGSLICDTTNGDLYINTNGATGWSLVGP